MSSELNDKTGTFSLFDENNQIYKQYNLINIEDVESLKKECENQLQSLREKKMKEDDRLKKSSRPLKTKFKDLERFDPIFVIETYPITKEFTEGYRILKCYVSAISHKKDEKTGKPYIALSVEHDEYPAGVYGKYIPVEVFDKSYHLDVYIGPRFYTLDIDNWERDFVAAYSNQFHEMRQNVEIQINNHKEMIGKFIADKEIITRLLKEQSKL